MWQATEQSSSHLVTEKNSTEQSLSSHGAQECRLVKPRCPSLESLEAESQLQPQRSMDQEQRHGGAAEVGMHTAQLRLPLHSASRCDESHFPIGPAPSRTGRQSQLLQGMGKGMVTLAVAPAVLYSACCT